MTTKKTISVALILKRANARLAQPDSKAKQLGGGVGQLRGVSYREGVASLLEFVLHEADAYAGFGYLDERYVEGKTDESRRCYYVHSKLAASYRELLRGTP